MDGFFSAWESGETLPSGPKTEALHLVASDVRSFYLSAYTSWAGMLGEAASIAYAKESVFLGIVYILMSIFCAFIAHGLGSDLVQLISSSDPLTNTSYNSTTRAHSLLRKIIIALTMHIIFSCACTEGTVEIDDPDEHGKYWVAVTPRNRLIISMLFATGGAYTGRFIRTTIAQYMHKSTIPIGTLCNNAIFGLLGLSLNIMRLRDVSWAKSFLLRGFTLNFCGGASAFVGHTADNRDLYVNQKHSKGYQRMLLNVLVNLMCAIMIFLIAVEIEGLLHQAQNADDESDAGNDNNNESL